MGIKQRLDRLEEKVGMKRESRLLLITIDPNKLAQEGPYTVELFPDLWATALRGGPFTSEEIRQLREDEKSKWEEWHERIREHARAKG